METLEVHSKDFLIKWVTVPDNCIIDWQVKPLKKSINFGIYKKQEVFDENFTNGGNNSNGSNSPNVFVNAGGSSTSGSIVGGGSTTVNNGGSGGGGDIVASEDRLNIGTLLNNNNNSSTSVNSLQPRNRSNSVVSVNKITESFYKTKSRSATLTSNINNGDLTLIKNYNKLISNELVRGKLEVPKAGVYAFIFDNSFSKTIGKKILFSTKIIEKEPKVIIQTTINDTSFNSINGTLASENGNNNNKSLHRKSSILRPKNGELLQSILLKKRRKKLQGFVKRYFVLNLKYGTLSYFRVNDNKLRGQMPITQSIISANVKRLEIIIDSGMEIWDLKALNKEDFDIWIETINSIKKSHFKNDEVKFKDINYDDNTALSKTLSNNLNLGTSINDDLNAISFKLSKLLESTNESQTKKELESITNDLEEVISKLPSNNRDAFSIFSNNEFYDANEYFDSNAVVELPDADEDDYEDVFEDDNSTSESDEEDSARKNDSELSIIKESVSYSSATDMEEDLQQPSISKKLDIDDYDSNLYPLPLEPVKRPMTIPEWNHPPTSILSFFRKNVGKDLTSISMPVDMNEPVTILQKYAEFIEYCDLIDNALEIQDFNNSGEKILRIAAFAVSGLSSVRERERNVRKPFNPLLGETFELVREDKNIRLISEKVCHRPPVFATFVESQDWTLNFSLSPSQKFWGKTAEIINKGNFKLTIKSTGETYTWTQPTSMLKNIIAGEKYSEPVGSMTIKSTNGDKAVVEFAKGGMFSGRSEELTINAFNHKKQLTYSVFGKWTESLTLKTNTTEKLIWECGELVPNAKKRFGFTKFASELVNITEIENGKLAPTDSRLRPDLKAYLNVEIGKAEELKNLLEEDQRTRRKQNEIEKKKHEPLFFHHNGDKQYLDSGDWTYIKGDKSYWNRRANGDWDGLLKLW